MTYTRAQVRNAVRDILDFDIEELPNALLDVWLNDGYQRMLSIEERWPFLQAEWTLTTVADTTDYAKSGLSNGSGYVLDQVESVMDVTDTNAVFHVPHISIHGGDFMAHQATSGVPAYWTEWGGSIKLVPAPAADRVYAVRGFRKGSWGAGDDTAVDADERLHHALVYYGLGMAYGQQEDDTLKAQWMDEFARAVSEGHQIITASPQRRPLVLGGGAPVYSTTIKLNTDV